MFVAPTTTQWAICASSPTAVRAAGQRARATTCVAPQFLRADELALLYAAWPVAPEREAIRRAARGLWAWTRYVWVECEQTLGEELGISFNTTVFLEAIERPYAWERDRMGES